MQHGHLLDLHGEARHASSHVGTAAGEIDPDARWCCDHDRSRAANTRRNAAPSTFASTRTDTPRDSVISIRPSGWVGDGAIARSVGGAGGLNAGAADVANSSCEGADTTSTRT